MNKNISVKKFIIIISVVIGILLLLAFGFMKYWEISYLGGTYNYQDDLYRPIPPTGLLKTCGVVVKVENGSAYIMPTLEKPIILEPEKNATDKDYNSAIHYIFENNKFDLKKEQEVTITYHYEKDKESKYNYNAIIDNIEIEKEKSDIEIPRDIILDAYSSKENVSIEIDKSKSDSEKLVFTVIDNNEYKYDYSKMRYIINENDELFWREIQKISDLPREEQYQIDENGIVNIEEDWSKVYGKLEKGKYRLTLQTLNKSRKSVINPEIIEYPDCGVILTIDFEVKSNGKLKFTYMNVG